MQNKISILLLIIAIATSTQAQTTLTVERASSSAATIELSNPVGVAGLQFTLRSSEDVALRGFEASGRTTSSWIVSTNKVNDSTINVVILGSSATEFAPGNGAIGTVTFGARSGAGEGSHSISLTKVKVIDASAQTIAASTSDLMWNGKVETSGSIVAILGNYPNPFNPTTTISYKLDVASHVTLSVYDIAGREVARLTDEYKAAGSYSVTWNATVNGNQVATGIYFARVNAGTDLVHSKMLLMK